MQASSRAPHDHRRPPPRRRLHRADRARRRRCARHALLVDRGRIVALVPRADADRDYAAREHVVLPHHVLLPGLVNAHTHAAMSLFRGIADDLPLARWLEEHIWPREAPVRRAGFRLRRHAARRRGDAEGRHHLLQRHVLLSRCRRPRLPRDAACARCWDCVVLDFPTPYAADPDGYLQAGLAVRDALQARAAPRLRPRAACALHRRRRRVREDRHVRAPARPADRDASRGNRGTKSTESRERYRHDAARAAPSTSARPVRASSRSTACISPPTTSIFSPPMAAMSCTALHRT